MASGTVVTLASDTGPANHCFERPTFSGSVASRHSPSNETREVRADCPSANFARPFFPEVRPAFWPGWPSLAVATFSCPRKDSVTPRLAPTLAACLRNFLRFIYVLLIFKGLAKSPFELMLRPKELRQACSPY